MQDEAWKLFREGRDNSAKEGSYKEINDAFTESQLNSARLEKEYLEKFRKVLPGQEDIPHSQCRDGLPHQYG